MLKIRYEALFAQTDPPLRYRLHIINNKLGSRDPALAQSNPGLQAIRNNYPPYRWLKPAGGAATIISLNLNQASGHLIIVNLDQAA